MKKVIILVSILLATICFITGCASLNRGFKTISSDFGGGLDRTVTLYDYNGEKIREWSGKFDISQEANEIFFDDQNGKRVIIHGGIVVAEEN